MLWHRILHWFTACWDGADWTPWRTVRVERHGPHVSLKPIVEQRRLTIQRCCLCGKERVRTGYPYQETRRVFEDSQTGGLNHVMPSRD